MASKSRTAADRQRAADVRDWAAANGLTVAKQGRIPASVDAAYEAAMAAGDGPPEPGPDWGAAMTGSSPLDLDEPDPDEPEYPPPGAALPGDGAGASGANGSAPAAEPSEPPPASLDDARERLAAGRSPRVPPWAGGRGGGGATQRPPAAAPVKVTPAVLRDIEGKLALLLAIPAAGWEAIDPICGGAFADTMPDAIRKAVPVIAQSPAAMRWLAEGGPWILALDLAVALMPTAKAVYQHHWAHSVMVVDGRAVPARRLANGQVVPAADAPPEPAPDWSAYTTDIPGHVPPVPRAAG
jgi:hypothetical protein